MLVASIKKKKKKTINNEMNLLNTTISNYEVKSSMLSKNIAATSDYNSYTFYSLNTCSRKIDSYIDSVNYLKSLLDELLNICRENVNNECIPDKVNHYNEEYRRIENENLSTVSRLNHIFYNYLQTAKTDIDDANIQVFEPQVNTQADENVYGIKISDKIDSASDVPNIEISNPTVSSIEDIPQVKMFKVEETVQEPVVNPINEPQSNQEVEQQETQQIQENAEQNENNNVNVINDNKTLVISEIKKQVFLPYTVKELNQILDEDKHYHSYEEIISDLYVLPMDKYRFSNKARFKETYVLMRKKEKASIFDSLNIAFEQTFNSSLNPAIITACKNLEELDIYLECLDANETNKFPCFEIKYEMLPNKK